jgi:hypothetical protein
LTFSVDARHNKAGHDDPKKDQADGRAGCVFTSGFSRRYTSGVREERSALTPML